MRYITGRYKLLWLLTATLMLLASCSDDADTRRHKVSMELLPYTWQYDERVQPDATRGDDPVDPPTWDPSPLGYYLFSDLYSNFPNQTNLLTDNTVRIYITKGTGIIQDGQFVYVSAESKWYASFDLPEASTYYFYGFIPHRGGVSATLTPKEKDAVADFANGTTLVISGLPSVTVTDVCTVVGVKKGPNAYTDGGLTMGHFGYTLNSDPNHIFLLFDHLYSALRLKIKVDATYNALRTIRLKSLKLVAFDGSTKFKSKTDVTIQLESTSDGTSPIKSVTFEPVSTSPDMTSESLFKPAEGEDGINLTTSYTGFRGCFMPFGSSNLILESTYDVYDKNVTEGHPNGNLIRKDCVAQNKIDIEDLFDETAQRGRMYTLNLTVNPTYLYMLSEPDLDNPTITIDN